MNIWQILTDAGPYLLGLLTGVVAVFVSLKTLPANLFVQRATGEKLTAEKQVALAQVVKAGQEVTTGNITQQTLLADAILKVNTTSAQLSTLLNIEREERRNAQATSDLEQARMKKQLSGIQAARAADREIADLMRSRVDELTVRTNEQDKELAMLRGIQQYSLELEARIARDRWLARQAANAIVEGELEMARSHVQKIAGDEAPLRMNTISGSTIGTIASVIKKHSKGTGELVSKEIQDV